MILKIRFMIFNFKIFAFVYGHIIYHISASYMNITNTIFRFLVKFLVLNSNTK